jgi:LemA protein
MGSLIFGGVLVVIALVVIMVYNRLVALRQNCNQGWADIDTQLKQRHDLIPNLVSTVQGYAAHEKSALESVIAARSRAMGVSNPNDAVAAEGMLSGALKNLFALSEAYPDLKANQNFQTLQHELADVEDKLSASRRAYNAAAADYNGAAQAFPAVMFAGALGFTQRTFWELDSGARAIAEVAPEVKFS